MNYKFSADSKPPNFDRYAFWEKSYVLISQSRSKIRLHRMTLNYTVCKRSLVMLKSLWVNYK